MSMASDAAPQRTLADIIMERINDKGGDAMATAEVEGELPSQKKLLTSTPLPFAQIVRFDHHFLFKVTGMSMKRWILHGSYVYLSRSCF